MLYPYRTRNLDEQETLDGILSGRKDFVKALEEKDPMLGWNGIDICAKLRPSDKEIEVRNRCLLIRVIQFLTVSCRLSDLTSSEIGITISSPSQLVL